MAVTEPRWTETWTENNGHRITVTQPEDPAYALLLDEVTSTPVIYRAGCYICNDPEYARMGLPLCEICVKCKGHVPADDNMCDDCGFDPYGEVNDER